MEKKKITVLEVGPRDGFQNIKEFIPTQRKIEIIEGLIACNVKEMEITSFVSPKAIPQMADAGEVAQSILAKHPELKLYALTPNLKGVQNAWAAGIRHTSYVISLSKTHNMKNVRRTHEQSFAELEQILEQFPGIDVCVGIATIFGCPFEGIPKISDAVAFGKELYKRGVRSMNLADTIGVADPKQVRDTIRAMQDALPDVDFQIHIHDTRNMGMVNTLAAVECGITTVQSTLGGLGGCPFAPGASGNTATEDLVYMLERMGYDTGIDFDKMLALSKYQKTFIDGIYSGHQMNIDAKNLPCC